MSVTSRHLLQKEEAPMKPSDYIKAGWTHGAGARDAENVVVPHYSPQAAQWWQGRS